MTSTLLWMRPRTMPAAMEDGETTAQIHSHTNTVENSAACQHRSAGRGRLPLDERFLDDERARLAMIALGKSTFEQMRPRILHHAGSTADHDAILRDIEVRKTK